MSKFSKLKSGAVTDDQGKLRLHGAFTGGFSAGYFNSVGTIEGFQPSTFVSSRASRADKVTRTAKDYMEESDESDDSDEELIDEMIVKTGLDNGTGDLVDDLISEKRIAPRMKIKPSADFVNMEYSLLGDKKSLNKDSIKDNSVEKIRDVYEVNNFFKKGATPNDILEEETGTITSHDVKSTKRKQDQHVTSLFSSDGYSYEDGVDGVYNNDPARDRLQYTREEVSVNPHLDDGSDDEGGGYDQQSDDRTFHKKQRQLNQINSSVEKWLGADESAQETKHKKRDKSHKTSQPDAVSNTENVQPEMEPAMAQFIAPKIRTKETKETSHTVISAATSSAASHISYDPRSDELQHEQLTAAAKRSAAPPPPVQEALALDVNIFDLIKPKDKLKLQSLVTKNAVSSSAVAASGAEKLNQSITSDAQAQQSMQTKLQEIQAKARLNLINSNLADAAKKAAEASTPVVPVPRPMLGTHGLKSDSTFAGLQEAFKNRFTSASTASSVHQDSVVKEGMATASEYVAVRQLAVQAIENEAASLALLNAATEASMPAVAAPTGRVRKEHVKSTRVTSLWAPSSLLCKRYNIKPPEISRDQAFLGKSKIDTMLDLIQRPEDTSYTVVHTSTSISKKGGAETAPSASAGDAKNTTQVKAKKEVTQQLSASEAKNAMRGGMAHLLKNKFVSTSSGAASGEGIPPPPAPPPFTDPALAGGKKTKKQQKVSIVSEVKSSSGVGGDGDLFLGADMFSRLHAVQTDPVTATVPATASEDTTTGSAIAPTLNAFKSIFEESEEEEEDEEEDDVNDDNTAVDSSNNDNSIPPAEQVPSVAAPSQMDILRDRYTSSSGNITSSSSTVIDAAPTQPLSVQAAVAAAPLTSTMFVSRSARATTSTTTVSSGGFVLGGAVVRKRPALLASSSSSAAVAQRTATHSKSMSFELNDEEEETKEDIIGDAQSAGGVTRRTREPVAKIEEEDEEEHVPSKRRRVVLQPTIRAVETPRPVVVPPLPSNSVAPSPALSISLPASSTSVARAVEQVSTGAPQQAQRDSRFAALPVISTKSHIALLHPNHDVSDTNIKYGNQQHKSNLKSEEAVSMNALLNEHAQAALMQSVHQSLASMPPPPPPSLQPVFTAPSPSVAAPSSSFTSRAPVCMPIFNPHLMPTTFDSTLRLLSAQLDTDGAKKKDKKDKKKDKKSGKKHKKEKKDKKSTDKGEKKTKKKTDKKINKNHRAPSSNSDSSNSSSDSEG